MNLTVNKKFKLTADIHIFPTNDMYALKVVIVGTSAHREKIHQPIVESLKKKKMSVNDSRSLSDEGTSEIMALQCTPLKFVDVIRASGFEVEEDEPRLKKD